MPKRREPRNRTTLAKVSFYTFIIAAFAYLLQAVLTKIGINSNILQAVQSIVIVVLFIVVGIMGWKYSKVKTFLMKVIYIICAVVILIAVVLPVI